MILILCNDDPAVANDAAHDAASNPGIFGQAFQFISAHTPQLGIAENLFITAHGAASENGGPPILGNGAGSLVYNPVELFNYLTNHTPNGRGGNIFPAGYTGNIYISVCYTANPARSIGLSYIELLHGVTTPVLRNTRIFGQFNTVSGPIPVPSSTAWTQVANT